MSPDNSQSTATDSPRRLRPRRTKVIATIGPACDAQSTFEAMIRAGVNVARLNLSHGSFADHAARMERIWAEAAEFGTFTAILVDTKGSIPRTKKHEQSNSSTTHPPGALNFPSTLDA